MVTLIPLVLPLPSRCRYTHSQGSGGGGYWRCCSHSTWPNAEGTFYSELTVMLLRYGRLFVCSPPLQVSRLLQHPAFTSVCPIPLLCRLPPYEISGWQTLCNIFLHKPRFCPVFSFILQVFKKFNCSAVFVDAAIRFAAEYIIQHILLSFRLNHID